MKPKTIEIRWEGHTRCHTSVDNIDLATVYFRDSGFDAPRAARALAQDDGKGEHTVYEWLAIVHEARARLDRELEFRGR